MRLKLHVLLSCIAVVIIGTAAYGPLKDLLISGSGSQLMSGGTLTLKTGSSIVGETGSTVDLHLSTVTLPESITSLGAPQGANVVYSGPVSGSPALPTFRTLTATDIPTLTLSKLSDAGTLSSWSAKTAPSGTVADNSSAAALTNKTINGSQNTISNVDDDAVVFDDADGNFTAATVGAAIEELASVNGSGPNASDGKVEWSQLIGVPAGFADGSDDGGGGGGGSGTVSTLQEGGSTVGDPDIVTINFGAGFDLAESPDTKITVTLDGSEVFTGGDLSWSTNTPSVVADAITNAKMANMATTTIKGRVTAGTGDPEDLSASQARTVLGLATVATSASASDLSTGTLAAGRMPALTGDVTSSAGAVATTIAANAVTNAKMATMATQTIKGNVTGSTAVPTDLSATQVTSMLNAFTGDSGSGGLKGLVPAPSSGDAAANKFLKADGTFAVLPGVINGLTLTPDTTGWTISGGSSTSKSLSVRNTLTIAGQDASTVTFPANATVTVLSSETMDTSAEVDAVVTDDTGSGALVFADDPTLTRPIIVNERYTRQAHGNAGSTETFDLANGNVHTVTLDANLTAALSGFTNGVFCYETLVLTQNVTGGFTVTLPAAVVNKAVIEASISTIADATTILTFFSDDGGTTIFATNASSVSSLVSDTAYDATSWNGVTGVAPSKNAVRDKIEALPVAVAGAYDATSWNGDTNAPTKDAVRDKIETLSGGSPAGSTGEVQFNNTTFGAESAFAWDASSKTLKVNTAGAGYQVTNTAGIAHGRTDWAPTSTGLSLELNSSTEGGGVIVGLSDTSTRTGLEIDGIIGVADPDDAAPAIMLRGMKADGAASTANMGDAETILTVAKRDETPLVTVKGNGDTTFAGAVSLPKTITSIGTTGAQTIDKPAGCVNLAASATSLVVTDSYVTANSVILLTIGTNDASNFSVRAVAGSGSFTIHVVGTAPAATTRVNFLVIN